MQPQPGQVSARDAVRPRAVIEAGLAQMRADHQERLGWPTPPGTYDPDDTYTLGKIAALEWVLGAAKLTPLSCRVGINGTDPREIDRETTYAADMLYRRIEMDRRGHIFVSGVEETLMWARSQSNFDTL